MKLTLFILCLYIAIFFVWAFMHLRPGVALEITDFLILCIGFYVLLVYLGLLFKIFSTKIKTQYGGLGIFLTGVFLESLAVLNYVPSGPSTYWEYAHLFASVLLFLGLLKYSEDLLKEYLPMTLVFLILLVFLCLLLSGSMSAGFFDIQRFLILYLPLQYVGLILISILLQINNSEKYLGIKGDMLFPLGFSFLLLSILVYFYEFLVGNSFASGSMIFLQLVGNFILLLGVSIIIDSSGKVFGKQSSITYFKDVTYKIPIGLN